jgi:tetratricopeptide (TPR) repeat protein
MKQWGLAGTLGALACITGVAAAHAQQTPIGGATPRSYDGVIAEAVHEFDAHRVIEARRLFEQAHALNPNARTLRALGKCAYELKHYVQALSELQAAIADKRKPLTSPQRHEVLDLIDEVEHHVGTLALEIEPGDAVLSVDGREVHDRDVTLDGGDHTLVASTAGYRTTELKVTVVGERTTPVRIQLLPVKPEVRPEVQEANAAFVRGQMPRARSLYLAVLKGAPELPEAWRGLGMSSAHLGQKQEASKALQNYLRLRPDADDANAVRLKLKELGAN